LLDRESGTLGTTVEGVRILGLPLNGRNILLSNVIVEPNRNVRLDPPSKIYVFVEQSKNCKIIAVSNVQNWRNKALNTRVSGGTIIAL
jgi:hypothetical protein